MAGIVPSHDTSIIYLSIFFFPGCSAAVARASEQSTRSAASSASAEQKSSGSCCCSSRSLCTNSTSDSTTASSAHSCCSSAKVLQAGTDHTHVHSFQTGLSSINILRWLTLINFLLNLWSPCSSCDQITDYWIFLIVVCHSHTWEQHFACCLVLLTWKQYLFFSFSSSTVSFSLRWGILDNRH